MTPFERTPRQRAPLWEMSRNGFQVQRQLENQIDRISVTNPQLLPAFLTALVVSLPTDVDGWAQAGVKNPKIGLYDSIVIGIFSRAARSHEVTQEFLERIGHYKETVAVRVQPELLNGIALNTVALQDVNLDAAAQVVVWAEKQLPKGKRLNVVNLAKSVLQQGRSIPELIALANSFDDAGQSVLAQVILDAVRAREEKEKYDMFVEL